MGGNAYDSEREKRIVALIVWSNNCVQATPDYALLFILAQVSGTPEKV